MARVEVLKNVSINTGVKLYREDTIQPTTKCLLDFRSKWAGAAKNLPVLSVIKNLTYYENSATVEGAGTLVYLNKGLKFVEGSGKLRINLHNDQIPKFTDKKWLVQFCVKLDKYGQASSGNNQLIAFSATNGLTATDTILGIQPVAAADQLSITSLNLIAHGTLSQINLAGATEEERNKVYPKFKAGENKFLHVAVHVDVGAVNTVTRLYLNREFILERSRANASSAITTVNNHLNANSALPAHTAGTYYRYRFDDMTNSILSVDELVALDYQACLAAFA